MHRSPLQQYRQVGVQTARPEQVLLMLYDGAISYCERARLALERGDPGAAGAPIGRTQAIIFELLSTLNPEVAPDLCANLKRLYAYMIRRLGDSQVQRDAKAVEEVKTLLGTLREGWAAAAGQGKGAAPGGAP
jgi:flagellar protein FliS